MAKEQTTIKTITKQQQVHNSKSIYIFISEEKKIKYNLFFNPENAFL